MFSGEYARSLDGKGRIILPIELRQADNASNAFVFTLGLDNCIATYDLETWKRLIEENTKKYQWEDVSGRAQLRLLSANATPPSEPDKQGRIFIPKNLRDFAGIQKELVIIGAGAHIEIWSKAKWGEYKAKAEQSMVENASKLVSYRKPE